MRSRVGTYRKGATYVWRHVDGATEHVVYLGATGGLHSFRFRDGTVWDGHAPAPVRAAEHGIGIGDPCDHCEGSGEVWGEDEDGEPDDPDCKSPCGRCGGTGTRR